MKNTCKQLWIQSSLLIIDWDFATSTYNNNEIYTGKHVRTSRDTYIKIKIMHWK